MARGKANTSNEEIKTKEDEAESTEKSETNTADSSAAESTEKPETDTADNLESETEENPESEHKVKVTKFKANGTITVNDKKYFAGDVLPDIDDLNRLDHWIKIGLVTKIVTEIAQ